MAGKRMIVGKSGQLLYGRLHQRSEEGLMYPDPLPTSPLGNSLVSVMYNARSIYHMGVLPKYSNINLQKVTWKEERILTSNYYCGNNSFTADRILTVT